MASKSRRSPVPGKSQEMVTFVTGKDSPFVMTGIEIQVVGRDEDDDDSPGNYVAAPQSPTARRDLPIKGSSQPRKLLFEEPEFSSSETDAKEILGFEPLIPPFIPQANQKREKKFDSPPGKRQKKRHNKSDLQPMWVEPAVFEKNMTAASNFIAKHFKKTKSKK